MVLMELMVIEFFMLDMVRLVQWLVIIIVLDMLLMLIMLLLQVIVWFMLMLEMFRLVLVGGRVVVGCVVGVGIVWEIDGVGERMMKLFWESCCVLNVVMLFIRISMLIMMIVVRIYYVLLLEDDCGDGLLNGLLQLYGGGGGLGGQVQLFDCELLSLEVCVMLVSGCFSFWICVFGLFFGFMYRCFYMMIMLYRQLCLVVLYDLVWFVIVLCLCLRWIVVE